jgi:hypothetical protein
MYPKAEVKSLAPYIAAGWIVVDRTTDGYLVRIPMVDDQPVRKWAYLHLVIKAPKKAPKS